MCSECGMFYCPPGCPGESDAPRGGICCSLCGSRLKKGDEYCIDEDGEVICRECVDAAEIETILRICEAESAFALAEQLGRTFRL